jgi:indole-3-glycerol phosphate synthase
MKETILEKIVRDKRLEIASAKEARPLADLQREMAGMTSAARKISRTGALQLIAEVKAKSPSGGVIRADFDPKQLAQSFAESNASAISVLTDNKYFGGSLDDLKTVREAAGVPVLRKDFIVDPYQIFESKAAGADLILLIARSTRGNFAELLDLALELDLQVMIEVHNKEELDLVLQTIPASTDILIGVNNRDLAAFSVDINTCLELADQIPDTYLKVAESGIETLAQLTDLERAGFDLALIGTGLATNPELLNYFARAKTNTL